MSTAVVQVESSRALTLTSGTQEVVKGVALLLMLVDHAGAVFLTGEWFVLARVLGRLSLPLFGLLIAYNLIARGVEVRRYIPALLVVAVASEPFYIAALGQTGNIFWVLLAGVMVVGLARGELAPWPWAIAMAALAGAAPFLLGYGVAGVLVVPAFALALRYPVAGAHVLLAVVLLALNPWQVWMLVPLLALPLVMLVRGVDLRVPRAPRSAWWLAYPAHLALIAIARTLSI